MAVDQQQDGPANGWTWVEEAPKTPEQQSQESSYAALALKTAAKLAEPAMNIATSPTAAKSTAALARFIGGLAPIVSNPTNPMSYIAAPGAAWAAGKGGWFGGKMLQSAAMPIAKALDAAAPTLNVASGAQGVLDLAQMADPKRTDIGFMGIGKTPQPMSVVGADGKTYQPQPALINALAAYIMRELAGKK